MYAVIRSERFPEDDGIGLEPDISIILFNTESEADIFIANIPFSPEVKFLMLHPDESNLT